MKLLVGDVTGAQVRPLDEQSRQTRLGEGFYEAHVLQADPIERTSAAVADFAKGAQLAGARSVRVIATSAAREATNAQELTTAIFARTGLQVEIISGEQEADWAFRGATSTDQWTGERLLLLDVGGGSTEFILGEAGRQQFRKSVALGTVRLLESMKPGDPPGDAQMRACGEKVAELLKREVVPVLGAELAGQMDDGNPPNSAVLAGTGGTASILGMMEGEMKAFDRARLEATRLTVGQVKARAQRLWNLTLEERKKIVGLPPNRADVILTGVVIYTTVMDLLGFEELCITTRGLRFAALMDAK